MIKIAELRLELFCIGKEIVTFKIINGTRRYLNKTLINSWDDNIKVWRTFNRCPIHPDGKGYYAMHSRSGNPHYYFSANPLHIKEAELQFCKDRKNREEKNKLANKKFNIFYDELEKLLDKHNAEIGGDYFISVGTITKDFEDHNYF